jgi:hypothetical protein
VERKIPIKEKKIMSKRYKNNKDRKKSIDGRKQKRKE